MNVSFFLTRHRITLLYTHAYYNIILYIPDEWCSAATVLYSNGPRLVWPTVPLIHLPNDSDLLTVPNLNRTKKHNLFRTWWFCTVALSLSLSLSLYACILICFVRRPLRLYTGNNNHKITNMKIGFTMKFVSRRVRFGKTI